jgi:MFS family permease
MATRWRYEYTVVLIHWFIWGFVAMDRLVIGYLFPMIVPDLKLNFTQVGMIMSLIGITMGAMGIFGGFLSDKFGRKATIVPCTIVFSVLSSITGLARSFFQLATIRTILGLAEGPYYPAAVATIAEEATPKRRGLMIGLHQTAWGVWGGFFAAIFATQVGSAFGWRWVFYCTLPPGIILAIIHWIFIKEPKSVAAQIEARKKGNVHKVVTETGEQVTVWSVLKYRNIILTTFISICFMTWLFFIIAFGTLYLTKVQNLEVTTAGFVMSAWGLGALFGYVCVPWVSDFIGRKTALIITAILAGFATLWFTYAGGNPTVLYFIMFLVGFFGYGAYPVFMSLIPSETVPFGLAGLAIGIPTGIGDLVGGGVLPTFGGMLADAFGLGAPLLATSIALFVATVISLFVIETCPRKVLARNAAMAKAVTS